MSIVAHTIRTAPRAAARRLTPLALLLAATLVGCEQHEPETTTNELRDEVTRGPLKLAVVVHPATIMVGDALTIDVEFRAPDGYEAQLPDIEELGGLAVTPGETVGPRPAPPGIVWRKRLETVPLASGELEIPPLTVTYRHTADDVATQPTFANELVSNPLKVTVRSVLTETDSPADPRDVTTALVVPKPPLTAGQWTLIIAGIILALAAIAGLIIILRRRACRPPPPILPEVWALRELADLERADLPGSGRIRDYYYRLTEIVRSYIERKFGLAAPEMTTEEFLATLPRERPTLPYDTDALRAFLEACDLVKYAALEPRRDDADAVLRTARAFVQATAVSAIASSDTDQSEGAAA